MKKLSLWAKHHIWQSRALIVFIYILLNIIGIYIGRLLNEINMIVPQFLFIVCIILTGVLWITYPHRQNLKQRNIFSSLYMQRKVFDFSLGVVTLLMIIYIGNNRERLFITTGTATASFIIRGAKDTTLYDNPLIKNFVSSIKNRHNSHLTQREKLRLIKDQIKTIKHSKDTSKTNKILLIILSVFIALNLLAGISALSCNLSCSGSEALAIIVGIAGTFFVIFFLVRTIRRINHPREKSKQSDLK